MTEFPNNPDDVANRMSTTGDEWEEDPTFVDALARMAVNTTYANRNKCPTSAELVDYADGELDDISSQKLAEHERRCVACRKELRALRRMNAEIEADPAFRDD